MLAAGCARMAGFSDKDHDVWEEECQVLILKL